MRPSAQELNKKTWYRLFKVVSTLIMVGAFVAPWLVHDLDSILLIDGLVTAAIWVGVIFITRAVIFYVIYGKDEKVVDRDNKKELVQWVIWGTASFVLIAGVVFMVIWVLK